MLTDEKAKKRLGKLIATGTFREAVAYFARQATSIDQDPALTGDEKRTRLARAYGALAARWRLNPHPRWGDRLLWWHREIVAGDPTMLAVLGPEVLDDQTLTIQLIRGQGAADTIANRGMGAEGRPYSLVGYAVKMLVALTDAQGRQIDEFTPDRERAAWIARVERRRQAALYAETPTTELLGSHLGGPGRRASPSDQEAWRKAKKTPLVEVELTHDPRRGDEQESKHAIEYEVEWRPGLSIRAGEPYRVTIHAEARTARRASTVTTGESLVTLPAAKTFDELQETFKDAPDTREQFLFIPVTKHTTQAALIEHWPTVDRRRRQLPSTQSPKISEKHREWLRRREKGESYEAIAKDSGVNPQSVKTALKRTRKKLRAG